MKRPPNKRPADGFRLACYVRDVYDDFGYWHLFDDAVECLRRLKASGWEHFIVSNHVPELPKIVSHLGLSPFIAAVYSSANLGVEKPNLKIFQLVLADLTPSRDVEWWMCDAEAAKYLTITV